jgi:hypothetical protein
MEECWERMMKEKGLKGERMLKEKGLKGLGALTSRSRRLPFGGRCCPRRLAREDCTSPTSGAQVWSLVAPSSNGWMAFIHPTSVGAESGNVDVHCMHLHRATLRDVWTDFDAVDSTRAQRDDLVCVTGGLIG